MSIYVHMYAYNNQSTLSMELKIRMEATQEQGWLSVVYFIHAKSYNYYI